MDEQTIRLLPWLPATAMVQCDLEWADHRPVLASPRDDPQGAARASRRARAGRARRHRAGAGDLRRHLRGGPPQALPRPDARQPVQRRLLDPRHHPRRTAAARHPQPHVRRRARRRGREGRVQLRPARGRVPLRRRPDHRRQPRRLQERRQGDRRPARQVRDVHGQAQRARGQLLPHPPVAARRGRRAGLLGRREQDGRTPLYDRFIAGVLATAADFTLLFAPNINSYKRFADGSFAPTTIGWGLDNRTCAVRLVGPGRRRADGEPHPRRRRQPLPRPGRDDRRRAARHRAGARARAGADGQRVRLGQAARARHHGGGA